MKKIIEILLLFLIFLVLSAEITHAESGEIISPEPIICSELFRLEWPSEVKVDSTHEYQIVSTGSGNMDFSSGVVYTLRRDKKVVEIIRDREKYLRYFTTPWMVSLEANIWWSFQSCEWNVKKEIRVYASVFTYIWVERTWIDTGIRDIFEKNNILYKNYTGKNSLSQAEKAIDIWNDIDQSNILVVWSTDILWFFSDIVKLQKTKELNFSTKQIYIISEYSRSFLSKVIAFPLSQLWANKVALISEDQLYVLLTRAATTNEGEYAIWQVLSYEKSKTIYSLSGFLEFLAYSGFSYQLIAFLLSLTLVVLILNFLKQVVWFNVFGIYYPILFAITISSLWLSAFLFIAIGFIAITLVNIFSKRVHLLLHAKRSLLISLYIALFLLILGVDNFFELSIIRYSIFDNILIIFPLFITVILADKIFQEDIKLFSRSGLLDVFQYGIITFIIYELVEYKTLQYFLISYPDIVILIIFLNILVGRYIGLQVFEYFRFSPLLRKLSEEE